jgi:hypothetical protein
VLTGLTHEHDGPDTANLHHELVAELDGALVAAVQVGEVPDAPGHVVRGTLLSRYHPSSLSSSESSSMWSNVEEVNGGVESV